jgi:hypothetical protein
MKQFKLGQNESSYDSRKKHHQKLNQNLRKIRLIRFGIVILWVIGMLIITIIFFKKKSI